jgi:transglutaminase-like putative cysteine protease
MTDTRDWADERACEYAIARGWIPNGPWYDDLTTALREAVERADKRIEARLRDPDQHLIGLIYEVADEEGPEEFYIALAEALFPASGDKP